MHFTKSVVVTAASALAVTAQNSTNSTTTCHDYVIVSIRGTFEAQGPSIGFKDMIAWTLGNVTGGIEYDVVYPAAQNQTYYLGSNDAVRYIDNGLKNCPNQKYAVLGYSQGASATAGALQNYTDPNSAGYKAIRSVLVIGNTQKIPNRDNDIDQNGGKVGTDLRGVFYNASLPPGYGNGVPDIFYSSGKLLDICYINDIVCAPGTKNASLGPHVQYGINPYVQNVGAKHIIEHLRLTNTTTSASSGNGTSGTPTTSSGGSATSTRATGAAAGMKMSTALFVSILGLAAAIVL